MRNHLPTHVWRAMNAALAAVPHVSGTAHWSVAGIGPTTTLTISVAGWGPTLHETAYDVGLTYAGEGEMLADAVRLARRAADDQRALHHLATTDFGLERPLSRGAPDPSRELVPADAGHVSRMHVERVLADAMVHALGASGAAERIVRTVDALLGAEQREGLRLRTTTGEIALVDGRIVVEPTHTIGGPASASLIGRTLDLRAAIPHTLLDAAPGRPLGALVSTGIPALDAATVERADTYGASGIQLATPSDLVRIGDHLAFAGLAAACRWPVVEDPPRPRAPRQAEGMGS